MIVYVGKILVSVKLIKTVYTYVYISGGINSTSYKNSGVFKGKKGKGRLVGKGVGMKVTRRH